MRKTFTLLLVFSTILSCKSQSGLATDLETLKLKGQVKKIQTNLYSKVELTPNPIIKKSELKKLELKSWTDKSKIKPLSDENLYNKKPVSEIFFDIKGRKIKSIEYKIQEEQKNIKEFSYLNEKIIIFLSRNDLLISNNKSEINIKGINTKKSTTKISTNPTNYKIGYYEQTIDKENIVKENAYDMENNLVYKTNIKYDSDNKILSYLRIDEKDSIIQQTKYEYLKGTDTNFNFLKTNDETSDYLIKKETKFLNAFKFPIEIKESKLDKNINQYIYTNQQITYLDVTKVDNPIIYENITTKTIDNRIFLKSFSTYYPNGLIKTYKTQELLNDNQNFKFEYDYDENGNYITKYYIDINKGGITFIETREIEYY